MSYRDSMHMDAYSRANGTIELACRVAATYPNRIPSRSELMGKFGMSCATASRWRAAMANARGMCASKEDRS